MKATGKLKKTEYSGILLILSGVAQICHEHTRRYRHSCWEVHMAWQYNNKMEGQ